MQTHMQAGMQACTYTHAHTHAHTHMHTHMHACMLAHTQTHISLNKARCLITEQCNTRICQCPVAPSAICVFRIVVIFIKTFYWLLCIALSYYLVALLSSGTTISCGDYYLI